MTKSNILLMVGAGFVVVALLLKRPLPFIQDLTSEYRHVYVGRHLEYFFSQPITGYGIASTSGNYFRAAHNSLLSIANAGGFGAMLLWLIAWLAPARTAIARSGPTRGTAVVVGVVVAAVTAWMSTGGELLIYVPPTNLLPLVLAMGFAVAESGVRGYAADSKSSDRRNPELPAG